MKTIATFVPFADFNQPSFAVGEPANPLVAQNGAYTRYEIHFNEPEFSTPCGKRLEPGSQSAGRDASRAFSDRIDRGQGGVASSDRG